MKISVYRVHPMGASANADSQHLFSIVATDGSANYATPKIVNRSGWKAFDKKRIEQALSIVGTKPTPSLERALVTSKNISMLDAIPTDIFYNSLEEAVSNEKIMAARAWKTREERKI